ALRPGSSALASSVTVSEVIPTASRLAITVQTSPAWIGASQTQSLTALNITFWPSSTARLASTQAAMSMKLSMWPPCMTPRWLAWAGITRIESVYGSTRGRTGIARILPGRPLLMGPDGAGDDHLLHLARALADLQDLGVAIEAGDRALLDPAVAAVDVEAALGDGLGQASGGQLRHRGELAEGP